jgi:hypothetical protein
MICLTAWLGAAPSVALAQGATSMADILSLANDKNISLKLDKLASAVEGSAFDWSVENVYSLVDLDMPEEVCKPAATKAGMFWDSPKSMKAIIDAGRASAGSQTITINGNPDLVMVFEFFNEVHWGIKAAEEQVGPLKPKESWESDDAFWLRKRKHEEAIAAATSPWEGKIDATTFSAVLTGGFSPYDGSCTSALVDLDLSQVQFDLYRRTLGGNAVNVPVAATGRNVGSISFMASGRRRFEAISTPLCVSAGSAASLAAAGSKVELTFRRPHNSDKWTGTAEFKNAKTGARL